MVFASSDGKDCPLFATEGQTPQGYADSVYAILQANYVISVSQ